MQTISVTAIITTYKRDVSILKRAIDSVFNQTFKDIQLIVINDCPDFEGNTSIDELISSYQKKITYLINETNIGANASRNRGVFESQNDYIAFLDDDDEWLPNKIEESSKCFSDEIGLVYSDILIIENKRERYFKKKEYGKNETLYHLLCGNFVGGFSGVVFKKIHFFNCNGLDTRLQSYQDIDLWIRMASMCQFYHVNKPLIKYYITDDSISLNVSKKVNGTYMLLKKYENEYKRFPESRRYRINSEIKYYLKNGWTKQAIKMYKDEYSSDLLLLSRNLSCILIGSLKRIAYIALQFKDKFGGSIR